ncbi:hypothetical protein FRC03_012676 [Tulasnella sp. 419]|nr:hypothetical protein FRC03_012676 [Tulasnella sp. 419]
MLSSDMSWHHPISQDRQDSLPLDPFAQSQHQHHPQPSSEWDIFAAPSEFDQSITFQQPQQPQQQREYDLFSSNQNSFGPPRFRSDSSPSSFGNASPPLPVSSYEYLYNPSQPSSAAVSPPPSAVSTRPSTAYSYSADTISPGAVAPPTFAELMMDRQSSASSSSTAADFTAFGYQQPQRFPFEIQSPPASAPVQSFSNIVRPNLRHNAQSLPAFTTPYSLADPSINPLVKREEVPFNFAPANINAYPHDSHDVQSFIRPYLERYINSPNRSAAGECSVIVMSSKVAQKSYGTEKRFLCPPPTAMLLGNSWWSENRRGDIVPPKAVISISGEPSPLESLTEWSTPAGKNFDVNDPPLAARENGTTTYMGRCIGKQLFISDVDERKKKVEALVKITVPADEAEGEPERLLGVFPSRPIKVISKPSKKRQSAKNLELCINHGSTVSLFHRLRSQTVSTKYLCVSGSSAAYKGSDGQPLPGVDRTKTTAPPSFIAKTACWDSFVIYIIDVNKPTGPDSVPPPPPHPDYPSPPPNAIPYNNNGMYTPIYYNQTVVLQCLVSGVVSPPLIIRKVDHGTVVVGGGLQEGVKGIPDHYCAPGEVCGDPVSQLHKIALEVYEPGRQGSPNTMDPNHPGSSGSFLSCMGEKVNTYRPSEERQWNGQHTDSSGSPSLPDSPVDSPISPSVPDYFSMGGSSASSTPGLDYSNDGGRVRRNKRGSLSAGVPKVTSKGRRRVNSASSGSCTRNAAAADSTMTSGALWSVDIGETAVWTVVGTDQVRYDFYIPPTLFGAAPTGYPSSTVNNMSSSPSALSQPITPMPTVVKYLPPERAAELPKCPSTSRLSTVVTSPTNGKSDSANKMLTVYGENFNKSDPVTVFFGSEPSPHTEVRCTEVVNCLPPQTGHQGFQRPIVLVRNDGVVFPTKVMYP